jgi:hypothetical protein
MLSRKAITSSVPKSILFDTHVVAERCIRSIIAVDLLQSPAGMASNTMHPRGRLYVVYFH